MNFVPPSPYGARKELAKNHGGASVRHNAKRVLVIREGITLGVWSFLGGTQTMASFVALGAPGDLRASPRRHALLLIVFPETGPFSGIMQSRVAPVAMASSKTTTTRAPGAKRRPTDLKRHGRATLSNGDKPGIKRQIETLKSLHFER